MDFRPSPYVPQEGIPGRGFIQTRVKNFGVTMIVMGVSFGLYYLGLFGGIDGPLNPSQIGERLASVGFSKRHMQILMLSCLTVAVGWNWLYNSVCRQLGRRMICNHRVDKKTTCKAPAWRNREGAYVCGAGHFQGQVRFQPLKKNTLAHFLWMMFLIFTGLVFYFS